MSYLAFDLGAESGRLMLGSLAEARLELVELHRFPNRMVNADGGLHWDVNALFQEMKLGLRICAERHTRTPASIGIDTWGVDFGLLDEHGELLDLPFTYRDKRTEGAIEGFLKLIPRRRLYELTGVQIIPINSLFQLYALPRDKSSQLASAAHLLFIPDLFNYFLTGKKQSEFTFCTTSQLLNSRTRGWEKEILAALGIPQSLMPDIKMPGTDIGPLSDSVRAETGLDNTLVRAVGSHDTASAVAAVPATDDSFAYISSGTWSLMGVESTEPLVDDTAYRHNFTNEGAVDGGFRVLKNITGLWLLQECRRCWSRDRDLGYEELVRLAAAAEPFRSVIDPDDPQFASPADMPGAIAEYCRTTGQTAPDNTGQFARCILESLVLAYRHTLGQIRELRPVPPVERIHIIGGGSQNTLLCQMTADATGLPVLAGPKEATAIGNVLVQAMAAGELGSLSELRRVVRESFPPVLYQPRRDPCWDVAYDRFQRLKVRQA